MKNKVIILIGTSCSGKTTWAKEYILNSKNTYYVSRDEERNSCFGQYRMGSKKEESLITKIINNKVDSLLQLGDVIIDATHLKDEYIQSYTNNYSNIKFIKFDKPTKQEFIVRNNERFKQTGVLIPENTFYYQCKDYDALSEWKDTSSNVKVDPRISKNIPYNSDLPDCVICDLDGTLSMMNGRSPYDGHLCATDVVNPAVKELLKEYYESGIKVFLFSGRNSSDGGNQATIEWLSANGIDYDELHMRAENNYQPDTVIKRKMYNNVIKDKYNVLVALDDRDCIVDLWRSLGIHCFQVYYGNF